MAAALFAAMLLAVMLPVRAEDRADPIVFAAFGDTPYTPDEENRILFLMAELNRAPLRFVVHVGDFKAGYTDCSDALFRQRRDWFTLSHHPFFYVPGDNEWTDCGRALGAPRDPLERLQALRSVFIATPTLGPGMPDVTTQQQPSYPEHRRWRVGSVVFATLNVPGGDNNRGRMPAEAATRTAAVRAWIRDAYAAAGAQEAKGIVLFMQANPWTQAGTPRAAYADIMDEVTAGARGFPGAVLVVHGDTHRFRFDRPAANAAGETLANLQRLEVFGSPFMNWVRVTATVRDGRVVFDAVPGN